MIQDLERIEYRGGMIEAGMEVSALPVRAWSGSKIPAVIRRSIHEEDLLNLGGVYGDKTVGDPIQYDHLKLILTDDVVEITVFNRGIMLVISDDESIRRIHRILCKLENI
jgi:hypothetical protein